MKFLVVVCAHFERENGRGEKPIVQVHVIFFGAIEEENA